MKLKSRDPDVALRVLSHPACASSEEIFTDKRLVTHRRSNRERSLRNIELARVKLVWTLGAVIQAGTSAACKDDAWLQ